MSRLAGLLKKLVELEERERQISRDRSAVEMTDEELVAALRQDPNPDAPGEGVTRLSTTDLIALLSRRRDRPFMLNSRMFRDRGEMDLIAGDIRECAPDDTPVIEWLVIRGDGSAVWDGDEAGDQNTQIPAPEFRPQRPAVPVEDTITPPPPPEKPAAAPPGPVRKAPGGADEKEQDSAILPSGERGMGPLTKEDFKRMGMW